MKRILSLSVLFLFPLLNWAQCAMCRTQVANNVSGGGEELGRALNLGILYLFITPYIALGVIALLWLKYSKKNETKIRLIKHY